MAGAQYLISGTCQVVDVELRLSGQMIDVATGRPVGGLKATGAVRDLFSLEDILCDQAKRLLPQPPVAARPAPAITAPTNNPPVWVSNGSAMFEGSSLERAVSLSDSQYAAAYHRYYYTNDYLYGYGYPISYCWGGGFLVPSGLRALCSPGLFLQPWRQLGSGTLVSPFISYTYVTCGGLSRRPAYLLHFPSR